MQDQLVRLNKYLSEIGYCSRRAADKLIEQGRVMVNGKSAEMGMKVSPNDLILVDNKSVEARKEEFVYLALNKPVGIVCTTDTRVEKNNIIEFINYHKRIFPIGRLDKMSEGLILLTDDGDIVNKILRASNRHEKEYIVTVDKPISQTFIKRMAGGIPILGTITRKCKVEKIDNTTFKIVLTQGLNRQIRRMCDYLNYEVRSLKRTRIMHIKLDLPSGKYRELTKNELSELKQLLRSSRKTSLKN
ncbi:MAG: 23S rRNA pseudouridine(2604) synthase RluF [Flavobacteriaceae bacterium]|nr:23S rRNA pseudouridine(2604) synthase RluF [Bacteroidia bacterium]NNF74259.1 23S rRNA pseudouridine(2604) synthase RluF [Flavobacteriaceae bacterium]